VEPEAIEGTVAAVRGLPVPEVLTVVLIQRADGSRHSVAVNGGWVYDPSMEAPFAPAEYPDRNAWVAAVLEQRGFQAQAEH
jgi:hypothetical protein